MKSKLLLLGVAGLSVGLVAACNEDNSRPAPPPPTSQSLDTAQVLALAQQSSETSYPIVVDGGALALDDASDTSAPIAVTAM